MWDISHPATSHQPPATSHQPTQPPATSHQPPATSHQPPATSHQPPATSHAHRLLPDDDRCDERFILWKREEKRASECTANLNVVVIESPALRALLGLSMTGLLLLGCGASSRHEDRLLDALEEANQRAAEDKAQIAMLETRLSRMEAQAAARAVERAPRGFDAPVLEKLDHLIALNQQILLERASQSTTDSASSTETPPRCVDDTGSPREQLQRLVERLYGNSNAFRGGLSVKQSQALRVLLRPERPLDGDNPWMSP